MEIINKLIYVVMLLSAIGVVILVLLQHGKGADMGTGFGAGSSGSLFGASGSANFLSRSTAVLAGIFFICTLALAYIASHRTQVLGTNIESLPAQNLPSLPAAPKSVAPPIPADSAPATPAAVAPVTPVPASGSDIPK